MSRSNCAAKRRRILNGDPNLKKNTESRVEAMKLRQVVGVGNRAVGAAHSVTLRVNQMRGGVRSDAGVMETPKPLKVARRGGVDQSCSVGISDIAWASRPRVERKKRYEQVGVFRQGAQERRR